METKGIFFSLACLIASCATTSVISEKMLPDVTAENVRKCTQSEFWRVAAFGVPLIVGRFESCVGIDDLLAIITDTSTNHSTEVRNLSARLAFLHYMEYLKRVHEEDDTVWKAKLIKVENLKQDEEEVYYYSLTQKQKKKE